MTECFIKPGSVTKRPGHLLINKQGLRMVQSPPEMLFHLSYLKLITKNDIVLAEKKFTFQHVSDTLYYVNGNREVWETDIKFETDTFTMWLNMLGLVTFDPICKISGRVVMFKKLTKLECLFM